MNGYQLRALARGMPGPRALWLSLRLPQGCLFKYLPADLEGPLVKHVNVGYIFAEQAN